MKFSKDKGIIKWVNRYLYFGIAFAIGIQIYNAVFAYLHNLSQPALQVIVAFISQVISYPFLIFTLAINKQGTPLVVAGIACIIAYYIWQKYKFIE